jgi:hypothetical protein
MIIKIPLSDTFKILIKENEIVDFDTPLIKKSDKKDLKIHLAQELEINPSKIFISMKKGVGEKINRGDVLAVKKSVFSEKKYSCDFEGIIKEINHEDGSVIITSSNKETKPKNSFFKGLIKKIDDNQIELEVKSFAKYDIRETNDDFGGEIYRINKKLVSELKEEVDDKILVTKKIEPYNQVRLEVLGMKGYITLEDLDHPVDIFHASLKKEEDLNSIIKSDYPYCTVIKEDRVIYLYK